MKPANSALPSLAAGPLSTYFYASQRAWIQDDSPLKICVKSRQTGFSFANSFRLLLLVTARDARLDAHIVSRDQYQARLQAEDCLHWADILHLGAKDLGEILLDANSGASAYRLSPGSVTSPPLLILILILILILNINPNLRTRAKHNHVPARGAKSVKPCEPDT